MVSRRQQSNNLNFNPTSAISTFSSNGAIKMLDKGEGRGRAWGEWNR